MTDRAKMVQDIHRAKRDRILDLIRRATANGTHEQVAEAIARDWFPLCSIGPSGLISILISDLSPSRIDSAAGG